MKPLKLSMKAFGSYAQKTIVDFSELDAGLYLITGDTGAGKTTIFDAMVYALYGEASGSGRDGFMLHSDYASKTEDTIVCLEFQHNGKLYKVERRIHFPKSRDGGYGDPKQTATLFEEGKAPLEVSRRVSARVAEIIGLNADQFKQIIVLAQGEFQKFLKADSAQRNVILGKLFDNSPYIRFQSRLKEATKIIKNQVSEENNKVLIKMADFKVPEDQDEMLYLISNPNHVNNMSLLVDQEKEKSRLFVQERNTIQKKLDEIIEKRAQAKDRNDELDLLNKQKSEYEKLVEKKEEMGQLGKDLCQVDEANRYITPLKKTMLKAKSTYENNEQDIIDTSNKLDAVKKQKEEAEEEFKKVEGLNERNVQLATLLKELNNQLEAFEPYNKKKELYEEEFTKLSQLKKIAKALKDEKDKLTGEKIEKQNRLGELKPQTEQLAALEAKYEKVEEEYENLTGKNGLINKIDVIHRNEENLKILKQQELSFNLEVCNKKKEFDDLYERFLKSQANILSKELKIELETREEVLCPVCNTHLTRDDVAKFVEMEDVLVTKEQVERAESVYKQIESNFNAKHTEVEAKVVEINGLKENAVDFSKQVGMQIDTFDELSQGNVLNYKDILNNKKQNIYGSLQVIRNLKKEQNSLEQNISRIEGKISENSDLIENKNKEIDNQFNFVSKIEAELEVLKAQLNGLTEDEVKSKIKENEKESLENSDAIKRLTQNKSLVEKSFSGINGTMDELLRKQKTFKAEYDQSEKAYNKALEECGFMSDEAYEKVISIAGNSVDNWITNTRQSVQRYKEKFKSIDDRLKEQTEKCKEYVYTDLNDIETTLKQYRKGLEEVEQNQKELNNLIYNHQDTLEFIKERYKIIDKYLPVYERLSKLSDLANAGMNMEGGKITFDRYVMGNAFAEILNAANVHLSIMASGRYELIHQTKADGASSHAGLGIDILDVFTGEQRKPDSLSGGEKFQVSMALALGLSDVVQNHAGGRKIDSMYIDEGFGTLDEAVLGKAIEVLSNIAGDSRQIGIISHVDRLEESIPQKIIVEKGDKGSMLRIVK